MRSVGPTGRLADNKGARLGVGRTVLVAMALWLLSVAGTAPAMTVPILVYHRFGPLVVDSMTMRTTAFESQLRQLEERGFRVIPLRLLVDHLVANGPPPPPRSAVISVDDGHRTVYTELLPLARRHHLPVTLFVYPSAISHAAYALTWEQLAELRATGLFDIQSHSYWHPNFPREKRRLDPAAYAALVDMQLVKSKQVLERKLGGLVDLLAWPFGLYDADLMARAVRAGYVAAFTLQRRPVREGDDPLALPRFLITDAVDGKAFAAILRQAEGDMGKP
jgi:peptidoglycan/xylan/chitin deacetylase (PgdA/CDA1 family)